MKYTYRVGSSTLSRSLTSQAPLPVFFAFLLVGAGLLGWLVFDFRVRRLRRREAELTRQVDVRTRKLEAALETVADQSSALRTLDEAKSRFFANVSHEFRTPLSLILGPANDLRAGRAGALPVAARRLLDNMTANADRLMQLVEQLLDVARLESATLHLSAEVQDLIPLDRRMADSFASLAEQRGIAFRLSHPVGACADEAHVAQTLGVPEAVLAAVGVAVCIAATIGGATILVRRGQGGVVAPSLAGVIVGTALWIGFIGPRVLP